MKMDLSFPENHSDLKAFLEEWSEKINIPGFIENDPVQFPRKYKNLSDIEIVTFLVSTITWGNRKMILKSADRMLGIMGVSPTDYIMSEGYLSLGTKNIHRTFFEPDMAYICRGLNYLFKRYNSIQDVFIGEINLWEGIRKFRKIIADANNNQDSRHISNPESGSACKRLHLALRWLVRNDGIVDLGVWNTISPKELFIPLDVHVGRVSRELKLLERKQNDRKSVEQLTSILKDLCPEDPVKYDFALFGIGEQRSHQD
jgi:uncharacterized protein (TIGR02757 family)